jgi:hypothetical protein
MSIILQQRRFALTVADYCTCKSHSTILSSRKRVQSRNYSRFFSERPRAVRLTSRGLGPLFRLEPKDPSRVDWWGGSSRKDPTAVASKISSCSRNIALLTRFAKVIVVIHRKSSEVELSVAKIAAREHPGDAERAGEDAHSFAGKRAKTITIAMDNANPFSLTLHLFPGGGWHLLVRNQVLR